MASSKSGGHTSSHNYNLVTNSEKPIKNPKDQELYKQAKLELLESLDDSFESTLVNRGHLANKISQNRHQKGIETGTGIPQGLIDLRQEEPKHTINLSDELEKYEEIKTEYISLINNKPAGYEKELEKLDTRLAERITLDSGCSIEFRESDNDSFIEGKTAEAESLIAFQRLNRVIEYTGKIELISKKLESGEDYYVIKWTDENLKKIRNIYLKLLNKKNKKEIDDDKKKKEVKDDKKKEIDDLKGKLADKDKEIEELKKKLDEDKKDDVVSEDDEPKDDAVSEDDEPRHDAVSEDDEPRHDDVSEDEVSEDEVSEDEVSEDEVSEDEVSEDEVSEDEVSEDEVSEDGPQYEQKERVSTISNVTQVNRAIIQREVDEELRNRYEHAGWNIFDRANLFFRRKFIKDRMVNERMRGRQMDWSNEAQAAADRHQIEEQNNLAERMQVIIQDIDSANYPETRRRLDELLGRLTGRPTTVPPRQRGISDANFQTEFQNILNMSGRVFDRTRPGSATSTNWRPISEIIRSNNISQLSTNILMQANKFREQQLLTWNIADHIATNPRESNTAFNNYCRAEIKRYIDTYDDIPDFLEQMGIKLDNADATREIRRLQAHDGALTMISAQSLRLRIQMLDDGGEAYNVRKEGGALTQIGRFLDDPTGGENTRFGRWMNRHPNLKEAFGWVRGGAKLGIMMTPAFLLAPIGPLAVASGVGGMSFLTTLFKKKAHYERENRSYQRMQATNLTEYRNQRTALANEVAGMRRYQGRFWGERARVRAQYRDYVLTTQDQLSLSTDLTARIESRLQDTTVLSNADQLNLAADLADGLARLDYHRRTGQNFLGSNTPGTAEQEYRALQNAVMGGARRLGINMDDLRTRPPYDAYYNNSLTLIENGTGNDYDNQGYLNARRRFRRRSNTKAWYGAFKAGAISFGLSYLASSLASGTKSHTEDTLTNDVHGQEGGEYNLGDMQEHLFVTGDLNPTMNSVIDSSTAEITSGTLYSSVDAARCSAAKGAAELAAANADLATALSNPVVAGNPDLVSAIHNYVADATTQIGMVPGLSVGNHDLAIARAIEAAKEGILEPVIASGNTSIAINPTALTWANGGIQSTGGTIGQTFRNMGIMNLEFVKKGTKLVTEEVTRAIPIPVGLNTFGSERSNPRR